MISHLASHSHFVCFKGNRRILPVFYLFTSLILFGGLVIYISLFNIKTYAQSKTWYERKGLQPDTYYTYKVQEHDTTKVDLFL